MYRKRKKIVNKYKIKSKYLFALLCMISMFLIFNDIGIIQWIKLSKLKENSLIQVQALLGQQIQLKEEIFKLRGRIKGFLNKTPILQKLHLNKLIKNTVGHCFKYC